MQIRRTAAALTSAAALSITGVAMATPAQAAPVFTGGLVNVTLVDVVDVEGVNVVLQVPVAVAATVCDLNVAVLAAIRDNGDVACETTSDAVADARPRARG